MPDVPIGRNTTHNKTLAYGGICTEARSVFAVDIDGITYAIELVESTPSIVIEAIKG